MENILIKLEVFLSKIIRDTRNDYEYDRDEILDITSGVTDCEGCNPNSAWGYVRGYEQAIRDMKHEMSNVS